VWLLAAWLRTQQAGPAASSGVWAVRQLQRAWRAGAARGPHLLLAAPAAGPASVQGCCSSPFLRWGRMVQVRRPWLVGSSCLACYARWGACASGLAARQLQHCPLWGCWHPVSPVQQPATACTAVQPRGWLMQLWTAGQVQVKPRQLFGSRSRSWSSQVRSGQVSVPWQMHSVSRQDVVGDGHAQCRMTHVHVSVVAQRHWL
jgi:hypothetical protein